MSAAAEGCERGTGHPRPAQAPRGDHPSLGGPQPEDDPSRRLPAPAARAKTRSRCTSDARTARAQDDRLRGGSPRGEGDRLPDVRPRRPAGRRSRWLYLARLEARAADRLDHEERELRRGRIMTYRVHEPAHRDALVVRRRRPTASLRGEETVDGTASHPDRAHAEAARDIGYARHPPVARERRTWCRGSSSSTSSWPEPRKRITQHDVRLVGAISGGVTAPTWRTPQTGSHTAVEITDLKFNQGLKGRPLHPQLELGHLGSAGRQVRRYVWVRRRLRARCTAPPRSEARSRSPGTAGRVEAGGLSRRGSPWRRRRAGPASAPRRSLALSFARRAPPTDSGGNLELQSAIGGPRSKAAIPASTTLVHAFQKPPPSISRRARPMPSFASTRADVLARHTEGGLGKLDGDPAHSTSSTPATTTIPSCGTSRRRRSGSRCCRPRGIPPRPPSPRRERPPGDARSMCRSRCRRACRSSRSDGFPPRARRTAALSQVVLPRKGARSGSSGSSCPGLPRDAARGHRRFPCPSAP